MSNNGLLTPEIASSETLVGEQLQLNGVTATEIIKTISDRSKPDGLLTLEAMQSNLDLITKVYNLVNGDNSFLDDLTVMSTSIVDKYLETTDDWVLSNWVLQDGSLRGAGGYTDNYAQFNHVNFKRAGIYFLAFTVTNLPSGKIEVYLNDEWLDTADSTTIYFKEVEITDITKDRLYFKAVNVTIDETVEISTVALYYIADRFYDYLVNKVKSLATVDAENFITKEQFNKYAEDLIIQFNLVTNRYLENLKQHLEATNPHKITPDMIGAAPTNHEHDNYLTKSELNDSVEEKMQDYALKNHNHDDVYVKKSEVGDTVGDEITARLNELITVAPLIVTDAPSGILPSRFAQTDITPPLQILLPTTVAHNGVTSYDYDYGFVTTNREELTKLAPQVFKQITQLPEDFTFDTPVNFRICYHRNHKILGYKIKCQGKQLTDWSVYSGNTTFIHRITDPNNYITEGDHQTCEIFFDETHNVESLAFIISGVEDTVDPLSLWIEVIYNDFPNTSFGITEKTFKFCVPSSATNRVITREEDVAPMTVTPEVIVPNIPCYVFARRELGDSAISIIPTYIQPEYATICKGIDVLEQKFIDIAATAEASAETYEHPAFGTLTLEQGYSDTDKELKQVYAGKEASWYSNGDDTTITITQTFKSTHVLLRSYLLNWRKEDVGNIPDTWTVTVEGVDADGRTITQVVDSVEQYYPFYSVEDDDIVYHAQLNCELLVSKITLTISSKTANRKLALNKIGWYINEMYYSIPQNTMYYGLEPVSAACLGWETYIDETVGWVPTNLCLGESVVIPINNLEETERFTKYTVPNPFLSTGVIASVQNYALQNSDLMDDSYPAAYIYSITADAISVVTNQAFRYAVAITRSW